ncbi:MAG: hypothetical protein JKX85_14910 [Phycisphaeraceae bacterium]|nr:hypothetical protein [Phycisphaeraceae bacterium]
MHPKSILVKKVKTANKGTDKLKIVWMSILTRNPTASETSLIQEELKKVSQSDSYQDIVWALINTREFMFVQ